MSVATSKRGLTSYMTKRCEWVIRLEPSQQNLGLLVDNSTEASLSVNDYYRNTFKYLRHIHSRRRYELIIQVGPLVRAFDNYLIAVSIKEDARKRAIFLHCIGQITFDIFQTLPDQGTRYEDAKLCLSKHFKPKISLEFERAMFKTLKQHNWHSINQKHLGINVFCGHYTHLIITVNMLTETKY